MEWSSSYWLVRVIADLFIFTGLIAVIIVLSLERKRRRIRSVSDDHSPIAAVPFFYTFGRLIAVSLGWIKNVDPIQSQVKQRANFGPTYCVWSGWNPLVIVTDLEDIKKVLNDKEHWFAKRETFPNPTITRVLGNSLLTTGGQVWKRQRDAMNPAFRYNKMKQLATVFSQCTNKLIAQWQQRLAAGRNPVKVEEGVTALTLDVIGLTGFGFDFGALDEGQQISSALNAYRTIVRSGFQPLPMLFPFIQKIPTAQNRKLESSFQEMHRLLSEVIERHRRRQEDPDALKNPDLLDHILAMDERGELTDVELMNNLFLFFIAGHDTSSSTILSALYFLAKYPKMQQLVHEEVTRILGTRTEVNYDDVVKFTYLHMFIKETLRIRSPASGVSARYCIREGLTLGGYKIPVGQAVSVGFYAALHDPKYWPDPDKFDPQRFAASSGTEGEPFLLSFSAGPRICLGKKFAMTEMVTALALMVQQFEFGLPSDDYVWRFKPMSMTLHPADGLPLQISTR